MAKQLTQSTGLNSSNVSASDLGAEKSEVPGWFKQRMNFYQNLRPQEGRNSGDWDKEISRAWSIIRPMNLGEPRSIFLLDCSWNYGFTRIMDVKNWWDNVGKVKKEQRRQAKVLSADFRKLARRMGEIKNGAHSADIGKRILSGLIEAAFIGQGFDNSAAEVQPFQLSLTASQVFEAFDAHRARGNSAISQLEEVLEKAASKIDQSLKNERSRSWSRKKMRVDSLLGPAFSH